MTTYKTRLWALLLLLLAHPPANAQKGAGFGLITCSPQRLESGSPVLFTVQLDRPSNGLNGTWLNHTLAFTRASQGNAWYALAGIDVEQAPGKYVLELNSNGNRAAKELTVLPAHYQTTTLRVEQKYVAPDAATQQRIAAEKTVKDAAFAQQIPEPLWIGNFQAPVHFPATDSFGTRRMFNGELASIHKGTDFRAPAGTPVVAANDGVVILAQAMFYEGNLVVIDHGQQFSTMYMHLSRIDVKPGDHLHKGQRLGLSGATGRVTGPHLHLSARWQGMYVDPVLLLAMKLPAR